MRGRFHVEAIIASNRDVILAGSAVRSPEGIKHLRVKCLVDSGAARLVLPEHVASELQLPDEGETTVRYADHRREKRRLVSNVWLQVLGRHSVFSAVIEPGRDDALIGAIVLEELDLLVDCAIQSLYPREPDTILTEVE